ncbi:MAG TPA: amidase family protein, partial [Pseudolabrys sp.]|nr:amidase family protein [Pseudolabrys sp.]
ADDMCEIAIGTDTGGSCRTPAAFCGVIGFKPSRQRVPTDGAFPLSYTLDSIGPLAKSVAACAAADAVMAQEKPQPLHPAPVAGLRVGVAQGVMLEKIDEPVARAFAAACDALGKAGVHLSDETITPLFDEMNEVNKLGGGITPAEAFAVHRDRLERRGDDLDQNVRRRIERARGLSAADYVHMLRRRSSLVRAMDARLSDIDVLIAPTSAIVAPVLAEIAAPDEFARRNAMSLRNTATWNFFDCCAISLPLPKQDGQNVGLMLIARNGHDHRLFRIAAALEKVLR